METILELSAVTAGYSRAVIRNVSLTVYRGELVCLLGRNGCGKTTLFRAVLGSARIFSGTAMLCGKDAARLTVRERAWLVSSVSQQYAISPGLRAMDVIEMGAYAAGNRLGRLPKEACARIEDFSDAFGVREMWETDCAALSAGQRQLVHLTRAAVQNTQLMLLDEPNSALDFDNTYRFLSLLGGWIRREKRGALLILHDPALALRHADRILLMDAGEICGEIHPREMNTAEMQTVLGQIYPHVRILQDRDSGHIFCDHTETDN